MLAFSFALIIRFRHIYEDTHALQNGFGLVTYDTQYVSVSLPRTFSTLDGELFSGGDRCVDEIDLNNRK